MFAQARLRPQGALVFVPGEATRAVLGTIIAVLFGVIYRELEPYAEASVNTLEFTSRARDVLIKVRHGLKLAHTLESEHNRSWR